MSIHRWVAAIVLANSLFTGSAQAQQWNPQPSWKDSYAVEGRCYCDSNFDHGLQNKSALTPVGRRSIPQICADIRSAIGNGPQSGRVYYNDIQCGNGPANDAADEAGCPGRIDRGFNGCNQIGPKWDLSAVYGFASTEQSQATPASEESNSPSCTALGSTLSDAKNAFAQNCPSITRQDCDTTADGRWLCSSENITSVIQIAPEITPAVDPIPPEVAAPSAVSTSLLDAGRPSVSGNSISWSDDGWYEVQTSDGSETLCSGGTSCEVESGRYIVINHTTGQRFNPVEVGGTSADSSAQEIAIAPTNTTPVVNGNTISWPDNGWYEVQISDGSETLCSGVRSCDVSSGTFIVINHTTGERFNSVVVGGESGSATPVEAPMIPSTPAIAQPLSEPLNSGRSLPNDALYAPGDLVVLNYDSCPDRDDIHAAVAGRMVVDYYGLSLGSDYIVNNGACGDQLPRSSYLTNSPRIFNELYGIEGSTNTWQDVFNNEARGALTSAEKMAIALSQGRKVWIMEGGPSDFTFEVLQLLEPLVAGISLKNVVVVQHSAGFNQREADPSHLDYVRNVTDYRLIDDGNNRNNSTPQLNQNNRDSSRYSTPDVAIINSFRNNAVYGDAWRVAFDLFNPNERFDASDTVELLWILGLQSNDIADWSDFADLFLP